MKIFLPYILFFLLLCFCVTSCSKQETVVYTYDDADRLISATYANKKIIYTYDNNGNLIRKEITEI